MTGYYWDKYNQTSVGLYLTSIEESFLCNAKYLREQEIFLDIGAGSGRFAIPLQKKGKKVTLIETDIEAIEAGRRSFRSLKYVCGDAFQKMPELAECGFDCAFAIQVSSYLRPEDFSALLNEVYRILKPGGHFVFNTINPYSVKSQFKCLLRFRTGGRSNVSFSNSFVHSLLGRKWRVVDKFGYNNIPFTRASNSKLVSKFRGFDNFTGKSTTLSHWILWRIEKLIEVQ